MPKSSEKIKNCRAKKILDSRGEWTIEVEVETESGLMARAGVPQGKSTGKKEAVSLPVDVAIKNTETAIKKELVGVDVGDQKKIDKKLCELDGTEGKSKLGANAILGVSIACLRLGAKSSGIFLWKYIQELSATKTPSAPRLFINMINGGLHASNNLSFQEYIVIPKETVIYKSVESGIKIYKSLRSILEEKVGKAAGNVGDEGGFAPFLEDDLAPFEYLQNASKIAGVPADFGLDVAANNVKKEPTLLKELYRQLKQKYGISYLEDPFNEENLTDFADLNQEMGKTTLITGDDLTVTNKKLISEAYDTGAINAVIIKPNQIGTVTETLEAVKTARDKEMKIVISHRSGETNDDFISDLAWGSGADGIKLGSPTRGERIAKYNRLLEIEQESASI